MTCQAMKRLLQPIGAGLVLACTLFVGHANGQAAPSAQGTRGTKQRVANPLNDLLDEARRDIDKQDFEAAIAPLQKFLAEKDDFAYAHFQLGYAYTELQKSKEARGEYERAMLLDPKMPEPALNLGILLLNEEPAAAVGPLQRAVELLPTQSRPRTLLGLAYEKSGDLKNAASTYEGALALDPKDIETGLHLAQLYLRQNRAAEAEAKFRAVLSGEPASQPALVGLAQSLEMEKTERGGAHSVESLKLRADILIGEKKWDAAIAALKQAVALAPNDAQLRGGLGRTYMQQRDFANAEKELKSAIQLDAKNLAYWKDLASTTYLADDYPTTLAILDRVAKSEPPTAGELFVRALCYDKLQQTKAALDAYEKFLQADQNRNSDQVWQAQQRIRVLKKRLEKKR